MSWHNKVVWTEGLFLRPQLFQQQERYLEAYAHKRSVPLNPFYWGFTEYAIDTESLSLGKLVLSKSSGIFIDGTPFDAPGQTSPPPPLTLLPEHIEQIIYLAMPIRTPNAEETAFDDETTSLARYFAVDEELRDANAIGQGPKLVQLAKLRLRLLPQKELNDAWIGLPVAKVTALHSDGNAALDSHLIPPVTGLGASNLLTSWIKKFKDLPTCVVRPWRSDCLVLTENRRMPMKFPIICCCKSLIAMSHFSTICSMSLKLVLKLFTPYFPASVVNSLPMSARLRAALKCMRHIAMSTPIAVSMNWSKTFTPC